MAFVTKQHFLCVETVILHLLLAAREPAEQLEPLWIPTCRFLLVKGREISGYAQCLSALFYQHCPQSALRIKSNSLPVRISLLQEVNCSYAVRLRTKVTKWGSDHQISPSDFTSHWRFLRGKTRRCLQMWPNLGKQREPEQLYQRFYTQATRWKNLGSLLHTTSHLTLWKLSWDSSGLGSSLQHLTRTQNCMTSDRWVSASIFPFWHFQVCFNKKIWKSESDTRNFL